MLGPSGAVRFLLERDLLSEASIVAADLTVVEASRRNRNLAIIRDQAPSYFIKEAHDRAGEHALAHEAWIYAVLQGLGPAGRMNVEDLLPTLHAYDASRRVLVLEFLTGCTNLREYHQRRGRFPLGPARALGTALGTLHRVSRADRLEPIVKERLPASPPWVLSGSYLPTLHAYQHMSAAEIRLLHIVQSFPQFRARLEDLREGWTLTGLIHGDVRWDNALLLRRGSSRAACLRLIDWESAGLGDPRWDVSSALASYVEFWLSSIPVTGDDPDRLLELARFPLEAMHPAMTALWRSYRAAAGTAADVKWVAGYVGARLVQSAYEQVQNATQVSGTTICTLQVALNVLTRPREAAAFLLGI
jgi:aminoglycoside phosphotransferase (APT) family kinase protein